MLKSFREKIIRLHNICDYVYANSYVIYDLSIMDSKKTRNIDQSYVKLMRSGQYIFCDTCRGPKWVVTDRLLAKSSVNGSSPIACAGLL